jgi:hypothetical protein
MREKIQMTYETATRQADALSMSYKLLPTSTFYNGVCQAQPYLAKRARDCDGQIAPTDVDAGRMGTIVGTSCNPFAMQQRSSRQTCPNLEAVIDGKDALITARRPR